MDAARAPRQTQAPDAVPSIDARRLLYEQARLAGARRNEPQGFVALVLLEVLPAEGSSTHDERVLVAVTTRIADVLNRRLRSIDLLVRSASCELAVLLTLANIGVAAAFSERLRQPIEHALREMGLADQITVGMGLAANPPGGDWQVDALIELADFRMRSAIDLARQAAERDWALVVDGASLPNAWADSSDWPATDYITNNSGL